MLLVLLPFHVRAHSCPNDRNALVIWQSVYVSKPASHNFAIICSTYESCIVDLAFFYAYSRTFLDTRDYIAVTDALSLSFAILEPCSLIAVTDALPLSSAVLGSCIVFLAFVIVGSYFRTFLKSCSFCGCKCTVFLEERLCQLAWHLSNFRLDLQWDNRHKLSLRIWCCLMVIIYDM